MIKKKVIILKKKLKNNLNQFIDLRNKLLNAFSLSTLILVLLKCIFGPFQPIFNISFLLIISFIIYKFNMYTYFQLLIVKLLRKTLPTYFLDSRDTTLMDLYKEWEGMQSEQEKLKKEMTVFLPEVFSLIIFNIFILIRLIIIAEPLIYGITHFFIIYFLIFNKYIFITYMISVFSIISRVCFTLNSKTYENMLKNLQLGSSHNLLDPNYNIKPNYHNTIIISHYILSSINELSWEGYNLNQDIDIIFIMVLLEETFTLTHLSKFTIKNLDTQPLNIEIRKTFISYIFFIK